MHFHDNQRKVDYVLAYHYRKRGAHQGHGSPGHSVAVISNGETGKERHAGGPGDIELGPLDALEEERREQRDEFEHNLMAAGLELEKDLEVRLARLQVSGWVGACGQCCLKKALLWQTACFFFFCTKQILLPKTLQESLGIAVTLGKWFHAAVGMWWWAMPTLGHAHMMYLAVWLETEGGTWFPEGL